MIDAGGKVCSVLSGLMKDCMARRARMLTVVLVSVAMVVATAPATTVAQTQDESRGTKTSPVTVLHTFFHAYDSKQPINLIKGRDGSFYGETIGDGFLDYGSIFKILPDGTFKTLHFFHDPSEGDFPVGSLVEAADGNFYGTTVSGGSHNKGIVFRMTPGGDVKRIYEFGSSAIDGENPWGGVIQARDGYLYGTTMAGGRNGAGVVYRLTYGGKLTILHDFAFNLVEPGQPVPPAPGGRSPANLIEGRDGHLYGVTYPNSAVCVDQICGVGDYGTVFRISRHGDYKVLYRFPAPDSLGSTFGYGPIAPLMQASDGAFYGTTFHANGLNGAGTVFRMTPKGEVQFLHRFVVGDRGSDPAAWRGAYPTNPLTEGPDGSLYSTVSRCAAGWDCLYRIDRKSAQFKVLYTFPPEEAMSPGPPVWVRHGAMYGSAQGGGDLGGGLRGDGTVFRLDISALPSTDTGTEQTGRPATPTQSAPPVGNRMCELSADIFCHTP